MTPFNHCVLDSYGSVPNIEEESYDTENSSASISLSSLRQHQRQPSRACAVRAGRPSEAATASSACCPCTQPVRTIFLFKSIWTRSQGSQGCHKIRFYFSKMKELSFALRLPQKGTNFEKPSKLEKNVKKHLFS